MLGGVVRTSSRRGCRRSRDGRDGGRFCLAGKKPRQGELSERRRSRGSCRETKPGLGPLQTSAQSSLPSALGEEYRDHPGFTDGDPGTHGS